MSNPFSQRFSSSTNAREKPECYGDEDYYDPSDTTCRRCPVKGTCRVLVERRSKSSDRNAITTTKSSRTGSSVPRKQASVVVDHEEDDSFMGVLGHNSMLNAGQGFVDTLSEAVSSIPRKKYPNPFSRLRRDTDKDKK